MDMGQRDVMHICSTSEKWQGVGFLLQDLKTVNKNIGCNEFHSLCINTFIVCDSDCEKLQSSHFFKCFLSIVFIVLRRFGFFERALLPRSLCLLFILPPALKPRPVKIFKLRNKQLDTNIVSKESHNGKI